MNFHRYFALVYRHRYHRLSVVVCVLRHLMMVVLLCCSGILLVAQPDDLYCQSYFATIAQAQETFKIGVTNAFPAEYDSIQTNYDYVNTLIEQVVQRLQQIPLHYIADEEYQIIIQSIVESQRRTIYTSLEQEIINQVDWDNNPAPARTTLIEAEVDSAVANLRNNLLCLDDLEHTDIMLERSIPIEFVAIQPGSPLEVRAFESLASEHNTDIVIRANYTVIDEIVVVTIEHYDMRSNIVQTFGPYNTTANTSLDTVKVISDELAELIIGTEWGTISFSNISEYGLITKDGEVVAVGETTLPYQPIGSYTFGYLANPSDDEQIVTVDVVPQGYTTINFERYDSDVNRLFVDSVPSGAALYIDAIWTGLTPVTLDIPETPQVMVLKYPGYLSSKIDLSPDNTEPILAIMTVELFDASSWLHTRHGAFYDSLAAFILSVPIPILFAGLTVNYTAVQSSPSFDTLSPDAQSNINNGRFLTLAGQYTGLFISGVLLINSIVDLVGYLTAADFYHRI